MCSSDDPLKQRKRNLFITCYVNTRDDGTTSEGEPEKEEESSNLVTSDVTPLSSHMLLFSYICSDPLQIDRQEVERETSLEGLLVQKMVSLSVKQMYCVT